MSRGVNKSIALAVIIIATVSIFNLTLFKKVHAAPALTTVTANSTDNSWKNVAVSSCNANTVHAMYFTNAVQTDTKVTFYIHAFSYRCSNASGSAPNVYNKLLSVVENPVTSNIDMTPISSYAPKTFYSGLSIAPGNYSSIYSYGPFTLDLKSSGYHYFNLTYQVGSFSSSTNLGNNGISLNIIDLCSNLTGAQNPVPAGYSATGGQCGRVPAGSILASCTGNKVTVTYTTSDLDGDNLTVSLTAASLWTGAKTDTRAPVTNYTLAGSPFNFTGTINTTYNITGTVRDAIGLQSNLTSANFTCVVPAAVLCSFTAPEAIGYEPGATVTPIMTITRNADLGSTTLNVTQTAKLNTTAYGSTTVAISNATSTRTITYASLTLPEPLTASTSSYTLTGSISWTGGSATCPPVTFNVVRKPFFTVSNGDLSVGGLYPTNCDQGAFNGSGNLSSWANTTDAVNKKGANASLVAQIFGTAKDFYSASTMAGMPNATTDRWLTIANSNTGNPWGGGSDTIACLKNIYDSTKNESTTSGTLGETATVQALDSRAGDASQIEYLNGNLTISGAGGTGSLPANSFTGKLAIYATGDAYITGDIRLNQYYGTPDAMNIPFFALIVKGDIYVDKSVTFLDGMYIAQPKDDGTGGNIYTCSNGAFVSYTAASIAASPSAYFSNCNKQLTFNGIVQAKSMKLNRINGTLGTNTPAEIFKGLPELYLSTTPFRGITSTSKYDNAKNLPPSL